MPFPQSNPAANASPDPLLRMAGIAKAYGGVPALADARLTVGRGEIHALIGQNGAGKSTLIKILTGAERRDSGTVVFDGQAINFATPQAAQAGGISTIYQEINLVPFRSVAENVFLGREPRRLGLIDWKRMNAEAQATLERIGVRADVTRPLGDLNVANQQMVAIARAVSQGSGLVVMDEPTSSLSEDEVETLFAVMRQLKAEGTSVVFVSHKLEELFTVCDRVTVLRDGRTVDEQAMSGITRLELVARMLGRDTGELARGGQTGFDRHAHRTGETLLRATGLRRRHALRGADVEVHAGEIVGLGGLLGSGRTEVARVLFGADRREDGTVQVEGKGADFSAPADAIRAGLGFCSEDRKTEGIIPSLSVRENLTLAALPTLSNAGVVSRRRQQEVVDRFIKRLGIKASSPDQPIRELSGGNQQKVLLARWLCLQPKLLLLDEPTRGIDVGAKAEIQSLIGELAAGGMGVLMISSELEELSEGCDRVVMMRDGRSVASLPRGEATPDALVAAMAASQEEVEEDAARDAREDADGRP